MITAQSEPLLKLAKLDIRDFISPSSINQKSKLNNKNIGTAMKRNNKIGIQSHGINKFPLAKHSYPNNNTANTVQAPRKKRVRNDKEKDPNAPKRPANPFIQYFIEQRSVVMFDMINDLQPGETGETI